MIAMNPQEKTQLELPSSEHLQIVSNKVRHPIMGEDPTVFTEIYQEETNIVVWRRSLTIELKKNVSELLTVSPKFKSVLTVTPDSVHNSVAESFGHTSLPALTESISELVDMFCCLFELKHTGLRLTALDSPMCPRFHVDRVPCRLVTTFQSVATEWLPHDCVDRSKLGLGSNGLPDHESGIYKHAQDIQQLSAGDVALLKGESWQNNDHAGLVHRSPALPKEEHRLLLSLDFQ